MLLSYQLTQGVGDHSRGGSGSLAACVGEPWDHGRAHAQAQAREAVQPNEEIGGHAIVGTPAVASPARRE